MGTLIKLSTSYDKFTALNYDVRHLSRLCDGRAQEAYVHVKHFNQRKTCASEFFDRLFYSDIIPYIISKEAIKKFRSTCFSCKSSFLVDVMKLVYYLRIIVETA